MQPKFLILLVDDDPLLLDILTRASRNTFPEASFVQVQSNSQAISYIEELDTYGPKLVLLDISLGTDQSGYDFAFYLKVHPQGRFLPVVVLSVDQLPINITSAYISGISSYTVKPYSFEEWKIYFAILRGYWFTTVTIPPIRFQKLLEISK
jgi:CheY-like chemotaxis protein